jgi:hypothetical protein
MFSPTALTIHDINKLSRKLTIWAKPVGQKNVTMVSVVDPDLVGSGYTSTKCKVKPHFFAENFNIVSKLFEIMTPMRLTRNIKQCNCCE